jgi:hypothetical protein
LFQTGFKTAPGRVFAEEMLCLQIPTWELNPSISASEYDKYSELNHDLFMTEFGAEWPKEKTQPDIVPPDVFNVKREPMTDMQNLEGTLSELIAVMNAMSPDIKILAAEVEEKNRLKALAEQEAKREGELFMFRVETKKKEIQVFLASLAHTPAPAGVYKFPAPISGAPLSDLFGLVERSHLSDLFGLVERSHLSDLFGLVERSHLLGPVERSQIFRVSDVVLNTNAFLDLCEFGGDILDLESQEALLEKGVMAALWGAKVWVSPDCPVDQVFVLSADEGFESGTLMWSMGIITR